MILDRLREQARARPRRVLLPEAQDPRVLEAARMLEADKLVIPVLMSAPELAAYEGRIDDTLAVVLAKQGIDAVEQARQDPLQRAAVLLRWARWMPRWRSIATGQCVATACAA